MGKIKSYIIAKSIGLYLNLLSYVQPEKASLLAYRFFTEPRTGRLVKDKLPPVLKDSFGETLNHKDTDFQTYVWPGNEKVILLVHGWESNASRWENMLPYLQKTGCTIVAIDAPAHGLSSGTEFNLVMYAEIIDAAARKFKPQFLIGHSVGAASCIYYQYKYQNPHIRKIVSLGAPSDLKVIFRNYVSLLSLNTRMSALMEQYFIDRFRFKIEDFSARVFGSALKTRGIIAHDVADEVVAFDEAKKIAGSWKNAVFIETEGLGHSLHDDKLYRRVSDFLFDAED
ncbi:MAG: alpha/beta fold hydrolase [Flavobacterium sp.]|nr:MAG: alpha/beta fold hydrolase [Flavobacterium sp.]